MKNLKPAQKLVLIVTLLIGLFLLLYWYIQGHSIEDNNTYEVNSNGLDQNLLIATQGSPFKDSVTTVIYEHYKSGSVVVEVIDIKSLANTDTANFDAILLLYRWEANAPPYPVQLFMDENPGLENKSVILTTSWNGLEKVKNIDALTGASVVKDVPVLTRKIIKKLDRILKHKY